MERSDRINDYSNLSQLAFHWQNASFFYLSRDINFKSSARDLPGTSVIFSPPLVAGINKSRRNSAIIIDASNFCVDE